MSGRQQAARRRILPEHQAAFGLAQRKHLRRKRRQETVGPHFAAEGFAGFKQQHDFGFSGLRFFGLRPRPCRKLGGGNRRDQKHAQRKPVAGVGHGQRAERRQEKEVPAKKAQNRAEDRRAEAEPNGAGDDDRQVQQRRLPFVERVPQQPEHPGCRCNPGGGPQPAAGAKARQRAVLSWRGIRLVYCVLPNRGNRERGVESSSLGKASCGRKRRLARLVFYPQGTSPSEEFSTPRLRHASSSPRHVFAMPRLRHALPAFIVCVCFFRRVAAPCKQENPLGFPKKLPI